MPHAKKISRLSVKTQAGIFLLERNRKGFYAVYFPKQQRRLPISSLTPLWRKLRHAKLDLSGYTDFQKCVFRTLMRIPAGKTVSYGDLAKRAGYPGAARAVGTAMRKNRLPIVIPCHRVVPAQGGIGAYSAGRHWKRWLLENEKRGPCDSL